MNSKIYPLLVRVRFVHWAGIFMALLAVGMGTIVFPGTLKFSRQQGQINLLSREIAAAHAEQQKWGDLDIAAAVRIRELAMIRDKTLRPGDYSRAISVLTRMAEEMGLFILSLKPAAENEPKGAPAQKVLPSFLEVKVEGRYQALGAFFEAIEQNPLLMRVKEFHMESQNVRPGILRAEITLMTYTDAF